MASLVVNGIDIEAVKEQLVLLGHDVDEDTIVQFVSHLDLNSSDSCNPSGSRGEPQELQQEATDASSICGRDAAGKPIDQEDCTRTSSIYDTARQRLHTAARTSTLPLKGPAATAAAAPDVSPPRLSLNQRCRLLLKDQHTGSPSPQKPPTADNTAHSTQPWYSAPPTSAAPAAPSSYSRNLPGDSSTKEVPSGAQPDTLMIGTTHQAAATAEATLLDTRSRDQHQPQPAAAGVHSSERAASGSMYWLQKLQQLEAEASSNSEADTDVRSAPAAPAAAGGCSSSGRSGHGAQALLARLAASSSSRGQHDGPQAMAGDASDSDDELSAEDGAKWLRGAAESGQQQQQQQWAMDRTWQQLKSLHQQHLPQQQPGSDVITIAVPTRAAPAVPKTTGLLSAAGSGHKGDTAGGGASRNTLLSIRATRAAAGQGFRLHSLLYSADEEGHSDGDTEERAVSDASSDGYLGGRQDHAAAAAASGYGGWEGDNEEDEESSQDDGEEEESELDLPQVELPAYWSAPLSASGSGGRASRGQLPAATTTAPTAAAGGVSRAAPLSVPAVGAGGGGGGSSSSLAALRAGLVPLGVPPSREPSGMMSPGLGAYGLPSPWGVSLGLEGSGGESIMAQLGQDGSAQKRRHPLQSPGRAADPLYKAPRSPVGCMGQLLGHNRDPGPPSPLALRLTPLAPRPGLAWDTSRAAAAAAGRRGGGGGRGAVAGSKSASRQAAAAAGGGGGGGGGSRAVARRALLAGVGGTGSSCSSSTTSSRSVRRTPPSAGAGGGSAGLRQEASSSSNGSGPAAAAAAAAAAGGGSRRSKDVDWRRGSTASMHSMGFSGRGKPMAPGVQKVDRVARYQQLKDTWQKDRFLRGGAGGATATSTTSR